MVSASQDISKRSSATEEGALALAFAVALAFLSVILEGDLLLHPETFGNKGPPGAPFMPTHLGHEWAATETRGPTTNAAFSVSNRVLLLPLIEKISQIGGLQVPHVRELIVLAKNHLPMAIQNSKGRDSTKINATTLGNILIRVDMADIDVHLHKIFGKNLRIRRLIGIDIEHLAIRTPVTAKVYKDALVLTMRLSDSGVEIGLRSRGFRINMLFDNRALSNGRDGKNDTENGRGDYFAESHEVFPFELSDSSSAKPMRAAKQIMQNIDFAQESANRALRSCLAFAFVFAGGRRGL
jgi:hypothetical protein